MIGAIFGPRRPPPSVYFQLGVAIPFVIGAIFGLEGERWKRELTQSVAIPFVIGAIFGRGTLRAHISRARVAIPFVIGAIFGLIWFPPGPLFARGRNPLCDRGYLRTKDSRGPGRKWL